MSNPSGNSKSEVRSPNQTRPFVHRATLIPGVLLMVAAAALLLASLKLPLWEMRLEAPQYRGEEALHIKVHPGAMKGDVRELSVLNQYIGVHVPERLWQFNWLPGVVIAGALLGLTASFLRGRARVLGLVLVCSGLAGALGVAAIQAQKQMHDIGHHRDSKTILVGVHDFTPPFLGSAKIAQFQVSSRLGASAWLIGIALGLQLTAAALSRSRKASSEVNPESLRKPAAPPGTRDPPRDRSVPFMKATRILLICGVTLLLVVFVIGIYLVPKLQSGSPDTARQSDASRVSVVDVFVDATYATPDFVRRVKLEPYLKQWEGRAQPFLIGINTHVGTIADLDLRGKVLVEDSNGDRYPSLGTPVVLSEHHNMYLLVFPLVDNSGNAIFAPKRGHFRLIVDGVGKTPERVFHWKLPVIEPAPARTIASTLMLALGVIGALMVILSPCAIELTTYYTGIIAGVVSSAAIAHSATRLPVELRGRILRNLAAFVVGFTVLYMASGATVALMGQQLLAMQTRLQGASSIEEAFCGRPPEASENAAVTASPAGGAHAQHGPGFGTWTRYANWLGAAFLVYFALKSVGILKRGSQCFVLLAKGGRKFRQGIAAVVGLVSPKRAAVIRAPGLSLREPGNITPANSFCAGLGLSVSCLTCMGGAILYPLLIFVGTSTWYWGALILGTYSIALAVPMAAIALGVGNWSWQFVHRPWLTRGLQWTSATVMILVATLIVFDRTRLINTAVFSVLSMFGGNPASTLAKM